MKIAVLTLCIGADYRKGMKPCLDSKREYCERHGYTYVEGGEEFWDRSRPIAWSKMRFYREFLERALKEKTFDLVWFSDADVYITNMEKRIEDHVAPLLPADKDALFCVDAFDHINSGNIFARPSQRLCDWLTRVDGRKECENHIWWENAAMLLEWRDHPEDLAWFEIYEADPTRFNAYLSGLPGKGLWEPGCWLVHFAGVYDAKRIAGLCDLIKRGEVPRIQT